MGSLRCIWFLFHGLQVVMVVKKPFVKKVAGKAAKAVGGSDKMCFSFMFLIFHLLFVPRPGPRQRLGLETGVVQLQSLEPPPVLCRSQLL